MQLQRSAFCARSGWMGVDLTAGTCWKGSDVFTCKDRGEALWAWSSCIWEETLCPPALLCVCVIVCMALCVCAWIHVCTMSLCVHVCNFHCVYVIARLWRSDDNFQHQPLIPHFETGSLWCSHCGYWANWFMICRAFFRFPSHHKSVVMTDVCYYLRRLMGSGVSNSGLQPTILN